MTCGVGGGESADGGVCARAEVGSRATWPGNGGAGLPSGLWGCPVRGLCGRAGPTSLTPVAREGFAGAWGGNGVMASGRAGPSGTGSGARRPAVAFLDPPGPSGEGTTSPQGRAFARHGAVSAPADGRTGLIQTGSRRCWALRFPGWEVSFTRKDLAS